MVHGSTNLVLKVPSSSTGKYFLSRSLWKTLKSLLQQDQILRTSKSRFNLRKSKLNKTIVAFLVVYNSTGGSLLPQRGMMMKPKSFRKALGFGIKSLYGLKWQLVRIKRFHLSQSWRYLSWTLSQPILIIFQRHWSKVKPGGQLSFDKIRQVNWKNKDKNRRNNLWEVPLS